MGNKIVIYDEAKNNYKDDNLCNYLIEIYFIIGDLIDHKNDYEKFCTINASEKANIAIARELFVDVRTLLRYKKRYKEIKNNIKANLTVFLNIANKYYNT